MLNVVKKRPIISSVLCVLVVLGIYFSGYVVRALEQGYGPIGVNSAAGLFPWLDGDNEYITLHHLRTDDPHYDLYISETENTYTEFGRVSALVRCKDDDYICLEWPFVFAFPKRGAPDEDGWSVDGYDFYILAHTEREFCGRRLKTYLIEGTNSEGWASRVWYRPNFGIYEVMTGQAEEGRLVQIERTYSTCTQGFMDQQLIYTD